MAKMPRKALSDLAAETQAEASAGDAQSDVTTASTSAEVAPTGEGQGMKRPQNRKRADKSRLNINLPTDLYDRFQELADREGGSMTFLITQYVKAAIDADDGLPWR